MGERRARIRFVVVATGVLMAGGAGYLGFVAVVDQRAEMAGLLVLAAATGFAAFFSPCSFPLMLTFLARESSGPAGLARSIVLVAGGAATFFALLGIVVGLTGSWLGEVVNFRSPFGRVLRFAVAAFLIVFGLRQSGLLRWRAGWLDRVSSFGSNLLHPSGRSRPMHDFSYGFGYLLAGFG